MNEPDYIVLFCRAFLITQVIEIPVVWYLLARDFRRCGDEPSALRLVIGAFFANAATLPCLWFVLPHFLAYGQAVALGELIAFAAEALLYLCLLRASWRSALVASLAANASSVLVGLLIMPPGAGV